MLPALVSLDPPAGQERSSSLSDLRCSQLSRMLANGSNTESDMVAKSESEPDVMAAKS